MGGEMLKSLHYGDRNLIPVHGIKGSPSDNYLNDSLKVFSLDIAYKSIKYAYVIGTNTKS